LLKVDTADRQNGLRHDLQGAGRDNPAAGRHLIPAAIRTTSPTTTCSAGICASAPVAPDPGGRLHHRLQGVHGALGLALA